jgi:hypothetical protein
MPTCNICDIYFDADYHPGALFITHPALPDFHCTKLHICQECEADILREWRERVTRIRAQAGKGGEPT